MIPKTRIPIRHLLLFGWMPSPLKVWAYRTFLQYKIGRSVKLSIGSAIIGTDVELADHVELGPLAVIIGRSIRIGRHSSVGAWSYVSCVTIEIGEDARIREQVYVGGPMLPESRFSLGDRTIVLQMAYINPTKPVVIGDDSGIGGHCLIFTHGSWLNVLDGYPVTYEPVTLGKSVWLPWRVFLMPGSVIGDGSVIGANSLVSGTIPPYSLAVGTPAKVIRTAPDFPRRLTSEERVAIVQTIMNEFDRYMAGNGAAITITGDIRDYRVGGKGHRLVWERDHAASNAAGLRPGDTVLCEVALPAQQCDALLRRGVFWLDLAGRTRSEAGTALTEELAAFLGRYGIRLPRYRAAANS